MLSASFPAGKALVGRVPGAFRGPVGDAVAALADGHLAAVPACAAGTLISTASQIRRRAKVPLAHARAVDQHLHVGGVGEFAAQRQVVGQPLDHHRGLLGRVPVVAIAMSASHTRRFRQQAAAAIWRTRSFSAKAVVSARCRPSIEQLIVVALPIGVDAVVLAFFSSRSAASLRAHRPGRIERQPNQRKSLVAELVAAVPRLVERVFRRAAVVASAYTV
jgi:hypothetical protein